MDAAYFFPVTSKGYIKGYSFNSPVYTTEIRGSTLCGPDIQDALKYVHEIAAADHEVAVLATCGISITHPRTKRSAAHVELVFKKPNYCLRWIADGKYERLDAGHPVTKALIKKYLTNVDVSQLDKAVWMVAG